MMTISPSLWVKYHLTQIWLRDTVKWYFSHNYKSGSTNLPLVTMDLPPSWSQTCVCGRAFSLPQAYTFHQRSCQRTKKWLLGALEKDKDILQARKCRKVESVLPAQNLVAEAGPSSQLVDLAHPNDPPIPVVHSEVRYSFNRVHHLLTFPISEHSSKSSGRSRTL